VPASKIGLSAIFLVAGFSSFHHGKSGILKKKQAKNNPPE